MTKAIIEKQVGIKKATPEKQATLGFVFGIISILSFVSLCDYDPGSFHSSPPTQNSPLLGQVGLSLASNILGIFGISAWLLPWLFGTLSFLSFRKTQNKEKLSKFVTIALSILSICILANIRDVQIREDGKSSLFNPNIYVHGAGGSVGAFIYSGQPISSQPEEQVGGFLRLWLGSLGATMLALCILFFCLSIHFSFSPLQFFLTRIKIGKEFSKQNGAESSKETQTKEPKEKNVPDEIEVSNKEDKKKKWKLPWSSDDGDEDLLFGDVSKENSSEKSPVKVKAVNTDSVRSGPDEKKSNKIEPTISQEPEAKKPIDIPIEKIEPIVDTTGQDSNSETNEGMEGFKVVRAAKTEKAGDLFPERKGDYHFPPMELLMEPPEEEAIGDDDHILKAKRLQDTLREFKIEVEMGEVHTGPVITRYDLHPAAGVRVEKIANLDKNLAMALKAESVRILAPVPGKGCVGIEVPNATPMPVCMKEILQSKAWHEAGAEIPIVLGKEASGRPLVADLTKMPHLLVAGSTGSGKTVCINAIIASLCYHSSPEDVRFIMVDPKIVEMKVYNDLPHMLIPVVTEPKKVPGALKWLLIEMERRYQIFSKIGVRNIAGFNAKILKDKAEKEKAQLLDALMTPEERAALSSIEVPRDDDALEIPENKLPYIVCIIDELADLMMVAQADVETGIARLAQLARAAGIHLIIATQRPSVNVITGVIKANLPSRISFRVASYRDSMTILDGKGAEALIGKGDMLFIPPGSSTFARAQGAFVSDDEINGIVDFLKINGPPQIIEEVRDQIDSAGEEDVLGGSDDSDDDPMTKKAIEIIRSTKRASTSNLQRKLSIGYNRAARIMDDLEDRGLVGPDVAGQGREILMDL